MAFGVWSAARKSGNRFFAKSARNQRNVEPLSPAARRGYVSASIDWTRDEPSGSHGKASEVSRIDDGAGHSVQGRRDRRAGLSRADRLADHLWLARAGASRNNRREPDAHP